MLNVRDVQNEEDLAGLLQADKPSAVMFSADWCPDCRRFNPKFAALAEEYGKQISFLAVDVAHLPELEQQYGIGLIPTVLLFQGGKLSQTWEFVEDIEAYRRHFDQITTRRA